MSSSSIEPTTAQKRTAKADSASLLPPPSPLDFLLSIPFALVFLALLLVADLTMRILSPLSRSAHRYIIIRLNRLLVLSLRLLGTRIRIENLSEVGFDSPYIVVANHQSLFDIPLLQLVIGSRFPRFIAKIELTRFIPAVSYNLKHGGHAIINRSDATQAVAAISELGKYIENNNGLAVIFPEGTRARDGKLKPFKSAGLKALLESAPSAKILPVSIDGSWKLMARRRGPIPTGVEVVLRVGKPILRSHNQDLTSQDPSNDHNRQLIDLLHQQISTLLGQNRAEMPNRSQVSSANHSGSE